MRHRLRPTLRATPALLALLLAACAPGRDYVRPDVETPAAFKEGIGWKTASAAPAGVEETWWSVFGDPVLDQLERQVEIDNQNLQAALAQYLGARAALDSARSANVPTVSATAARNRGSTTATGASAAGAPANTSYALAATLNWEIDVWGRIRRTVESAEAKLSASAADLAAARLSTQALLAQTYLQLRGADAQLDLYRQTVDAYRRFLTLTQHRLAAGVASPLDVAQAEAQLGNAETQALDVTNQRAQLEHAIAVLIGKAPAGFSLAPLPGGSSLPAIPAAPNLVPSTVLEHRPDIIAAERRMAAANAQIGVADAAYFPVLTLGGTLGYRNSALANLISAPSRYWSVGPALAMTLFDGGARSAAVRQADAAYQQSVASYRQTVLTVFQEVEDNLSAERLLAQEAESQQRTLLAARRSREISENQYRSGVSSALTVVSAQTVEFSAAVNAIGLDTRRRIAAVQLFKNLGGLWLPPSAR